MKWLICTLTLGLLLGPAAAFANEPPTSAPSVATVDPEKQADMEAMSQGITTVAAGDSAKGYSILKPLADKKYLFAMFFVALMDIDGDGTPKDPKAAFALLQEGAASGDARCEAALSYMYLTHTGTDYDYDSFVKWFNAAFKSDATAALGAVDDKWFNAQPRSEGMYAYFLMQTAASQSDPAPFYKVVLPMAQDSANQDGVVGDFVLAELYRSGFGVDADNDKALTYYRRAAAQGFSSAQNNIGAFYENGVSVPRNYVEALHYYNLAGRQGDSVAERNLCRAYAYGIGTRVDYVEAYAWCNLSAAQQDKDASDLLDKLQGQMTPHQIAVAQGKSQDLLAAITVAANGPAASPHAQARDTSVATTPKAPASSGRRHNLKMISSGTGFFVDAKAHIITNAHVIDGCTEVRASNSSHTDPLTLEAEDEPDDLALLSHKGPWEGVARFRGGQALELGEHLVVFGYPLPNVLSGQLTLTDGSVSALSGLGGGVHQFQFSAPVQPGNSGGPILDSSGRVIGMSVAKLNTLAVARAIGDVPQNVNFAINEQTLRDFLDLHTVKYGMDASAVSLTEPVIAKQARNYTVQVECWK